MAHVAVFRGLHVHHTQLNHARWVSLASSLSSTLTGIDQRRSFSTVKDSSIAEVATAKTTTATTAEMQLDGQQPPVSASRFLLAVEYDGTAFSGVAASPDEPPDRPSVGSVLDRAIAQATRQDARVTFSSRTDAGVHALWNTCHVDIEPRTRRGDLMTQQQWTPLALGSAINYFSRGKVPYPMSVRAVCAVPEQVHARFNATQRVYIYRVVVGESSAASVFDLRYHLTAAPIDESLVQQACQVFEGTHDFQSFRAARCQARTTTRHISQFSVQIDKHKTDNPWANSLPDALSKPTVALTFTIRGSGFLYHQVRIMVGHVLSVASGKSTLADLVHLRDNPQVIHLHKDMLPAHGLCLKEVCYDSQDIPPESWVMIAKKHHSFKALRESVIVRKPFRNPAKPEAAVVDQQD
ncbi:hypothetical protein CAOG_07708 [Capsaspora owczarzaki ATCC 30864]|uniref:tRNA pseudouridine synthase n=1 Tax=Capsaspora owczarzaki (strain ATCC 30864) TaxID=595528 RepID=A0A0D2VZI8_CAPO3|nr:hypothetical protein CAOG_07708 [Capsaspora owczarzaki ATCC 30864]KJE97272.1 hypothetical protein CAOG_007708 [Capsaspora owczarzaki ATCC 30864]|eukprot:XP_004343582.2 hypothetical protein CAOG_07708 [Capsaspora owczarzaki ATCC 30864]